MDKVNSIPSNGTLQFGLASHTNSGSNMVQEGVAGAAAAAALPQSVVQSMTGLAEYLATDVGAAWALAGELSHGVPAMQAIIFGYGSLGLGLVAVGVGAYAATTWLDRSLDGALHSAVLEAVETIARMDRSVADPYFGGDGFTIGDSRMMSDICSNWEEFWDDEAQMIAPIQHPPLALA
jgi:hypothetical protein